VSTPRLVATDLDGTVVDRQGEISDRTVAVLKALEERGVRVVFVTGRPPRWMAQVAARTGHTGLAVCANGAIVYDLHREEVVETSPLAVEVGLDVARRLRAALPEVAFAVETDVGFAHEESYVARWDVGQASAVDAIEAIYDRPAVKLLARHEQMDPDSLLAAAREVAGHLVELTHSSSTGLLEISAAGVSKASALARLAEQEGIGAADVVAFGDMPNDLPMLEWAGTSYAMANAHASVRELTDHLAPSNDDDGVAVVLSELFALSR
jgi:Cof subfamily protein (haloacid dehalogenase superfamily)